MTEELKTRIIADMEEMTELAGQYSAATTEIITSDIDETLDEIVERRGRITERIGECRRDIDAACEECTPDEAELVHKMTVGGRVPLGLSRELREIHKTAVNMHSVYLSVSEKEQQAAARVDARLKELRAELETVNTGRKTASGYSQMGSGLTSAGSSFNGRM